MEERGINEERRKYDRMEKEFPFHYSLFDGLPQKRLEEEGLIIDIGGGGLRFLAPQRWKKNEQLLMKLDFDDWRIDESVSVRIPSTGDSSSMLVIGTVMWCSDTPHEDQFEVGVRFTARVHGDRANTN